MSSLKSAHHPDLPLRADCRTVLRGFVDGDGPGLWDRAIRIDFETFKAHIL